MLEQNRVLENGPGYDDSEIASKRRPRYRGLTERSFGLLLSFLSLEPEIAAKNYELIRRNLVRYFQLRGCCSAEDLADEAFDAVADKLARGQEIHAEDPCRYFYGVARNILKAYQRRQERRVGSLDCLLPGHLAWREPIESSQYGPEIQQTHSQLETLMDCVDELPESSRELILGYYARRGIAKREYRKALADRLGISVNTLRIRTHRIRMDLRRRHLSRLKHAEDRCF
jgi:RNA polymerase sigma factor (sigma-70 family)